MLRAVKVRAARTGKGDSEVIDPNTVLAAALTPDSSPARVLRAWLDGVFELVVSPILLEDLERALAYPKLRERIAAGEAHDLVGLLRAGADHHADPSDPPPVHSADPGDDYLLPLAAAADAVIVSGDRLLSATLVEDREARRRHAG